MMLFETKKNLTFQSFIFFRSLRFKIYARRVDYPILPIMVPFESSRTNDFYMKMQDFLLSKRIVFVSELIDENVANQTIARLLALYALHKEREVKLYIKSTDASANS